MLIAAASGSSSNNIFLYPNGTIIVEALLFGAILLIVGKFVLPPLQNAMAERDASVRAALTASDQGRDEAHRLEQETRDVVETARAAARATLEEASRQVEVARAAARERGQLEHDRLLEAADATIASEANRTRQELAERVAAVVVAGAERVVGIQVDPARHQDAISRAVSSLVAPVSSGSQA